MRQIGTFEQPFNYEVTIEGMLDARMLVPTLADLLTFTETNYLPNGFLVSVFDPVPANRGVYRLVDNTALDNINSWVKLSEASDINANNGLSFDIDNPGTIQLGGPLIKDTDIGLLDHNLFIHSRYEFVTPSKGYIVSQESSLTILPDSSISFGLVTEDTSASSNQFNIGIDQQSIKIGIDSTSSGGLQSLLFKINSDSTDYLPILLTDVTGQGITVGWVDDSNLLPESYVPKRWVLANFPIDSGVVHKAGAETITGIKTFTSDIFTSGTINFIGNNTVSAPGAWLFNTDQEYQFSKQGLGNVFRIGVNSGGNFNESILALRVNVAPSNPLDVVRLTDLTNYVTTDTTQTITGNKSFTGTNSFLGGFLFANGNELFINSGFDLNFRAPTGNGRTILDGHDGFVSFSKLGYNDGTDGTISIYGNKITRTLDNAEVLWSTTSLIASLAEVDSVLNGNQVAAWGDSMTNGLTATPYPTVLQSLLGTYVFNGGIAGETSGQIKTRFVADSGKWPWPTIIWAGRNNMGDIPGIRADIASMVASLGHNNYVIVSVFNTQNETNAGGPGSGYDSVITLNNFLLTDYGDHFIDARAYIVSQYNPSLPQDVIDHANDCSPTSLRLPTDVLHLNTTANILLANYIFSQKSQYLRTPISPNKALGVNEVYEILSKAPNIGAKTAGIGNFKDFNVQFVDAKNLFTVKSTDGTTNLLRIGPDNTAYFSLNQLTVGASSNPGANFGVVGSTANNSSTNTILSNSAGTVLYLVRNDGAANIPNYLNVGSQTNVFTAKLFVKGLTSANANNTLQLQNSSGAILANFRDDGLVSFDGTMQLRIPAIAGDAGFVTDRGIWYNSTSAQFRGRRNGATISFAANPMTAIGDLVVGGTSGAETRLAVGATNTVLHGGTTPSWSAIATADIANNAVTYGKMQAMTANRLLGSGLSGTAVAEITLGTNLSFTGTTLNGVGFANPMTTLGDIIYGGVSGVATRLAGSTSANRMFLTQTGNGTISAAPAYFDLFNTANSWQQIQTFGFEGMFLSGAHMKGGNPLRLYTGGNTFYTDIIADVATQTGNYQLIVPNKGGTIATITDITNSKKTAATLEKTANYTVLVTDFGTNGILNLFLDATSGVIAITLPGHVAMLNLTLNIIKIDASANAITVTGDANINSSSNLTINTINQSYIINSSSVKYYTFS